VSKEEIQRALFGRVRGRGRREGPEAPVMKDCLQFLNLIPECRAWRQNVGGTAFYGVDGKRYWVQFGQPGMSDISGILHGLRLEIEVKAPGNEPSDLQQAWLKFIRDRGGVAFWCDSLDACISQLKAIYIIHAWAWPL
jgi:hypothetical protein